MNYGEVKSAATAMPDVQGEVAPLPTLASVSRPGALVIGGDYRGLGIVRSLGRQGIPVWVITAEQAIAATSRYALKRLPWPETGEAAQLAYLDHLGDRYHLDGWTIFPTGDETAALVSRYAHLLSRRYLLSTTSWEAMQFAYDKRRTYNAATELGLDCPWTYYPKDRDDVASVECLFPVILKPAVKTTVNAFTSAKAWKVQNREELIARYDEATALVDPATIMLQEMIPGGGETQFSYAALCRDGAPIASITARRTRQYPLDFGRSSSYVESMDVPAIEAPSRTLLASLRFDGLVELEYKLDPRDGRFKLLDVNPRVWGWHTLGRRAGVDFPYLQWQILHGEDVPEMRGRAGVKWVRAVTDVPAVALSIRRGTLGIGGYLRSLRGPIESAIMAPDDPLPAVLEIPFVSYFAWKRRTIR